MASKNTTLDKLESSYSSAPGASYGLKKAVLSPMETLAQAVAGIGPSATPGILVPLVFATAGNGTWLAYLIAMVGMIFAAQCINEFTSRSASPGSLYTFVSEGLGKQAGILCGWALLFAYIAALPTCGIAVSVYVTSLLHYFFGINLNGMLVMLVSLLTITYIAYKNIKLSAELMLRLELISIVLIVSLVAVVLWKHGFNIDLAQIKLIGCNAENIRMGLVLAIYGLVGFESTASLGVEASQPLKTIPQAIMRSVILAGIFFIVTSYAMVLSFHSSAISLDKCTTPLLFMANQVGFPALGHLIDIGIMISFFAAAISNINASSRVLLKMSSDGLVHSSIKNTHKKNSTPHIAIIACSSVSVIIASVIMIIGCSPMDIIGWLGSLATFGFISAYIITTIAAARVAYREKRNLFKVIIAGCSLLILLLALAGTVYPVPVAPYNILPWVFVGYMLLGLIFCFVHRYRSDYSILAEDIYSKEFLRNKSAAELIGIRAEE